MTELNGHTPDGPRRPGRPSRQAPSQPPVGQPPSPQTPPPADATAGPKRRKRGPRKSKAKKAKAAGESQDSQTGPSKTGAGGRPPAEPMGQHTRDLLTIPGQVRSDARLAARMISLGVVSTEQTESLLRIAFRLAAEAGTEHDTRKYAACMKVILAAAKLELEAAAAAVRADVGGVADDNLALDKILAECYDAIGMPMPVSDNEHTPIHTEPL